MTEVGDNTLEIEESQDQERTNFFESAYWKKLMDLKVLLLSIWMFFDVALDIISCFGYYKKSNRTVNVCIYKASQKA